MNRLTKKKTIKKNDTSVDFVFGKKFPKDRVPVWSQEIGGFLLWVFLNKICIPAIFCYL